MASLDLYHVFYQVARAGSISRAAEELFVSQPAVSQAIKQLEEKLGGQVFVRTPKGITLTSEGQVLFDHVEQALNFIRSAEHKFSEMQELTAGEIRIGASDTICKYYLLPYLSEFHRRYPGVNIQVTNRTTTETLDLLLQGKVDFAVVNLPVSGYQRLEITETLTIQDCFVAGERFAHWRGRRLAMAELLDLPLLMLEQASNSRRYLDQVFAAQGLTLNPAIELGSVDLLVSFAQADLGVSAVIGNFVEEEIRQGRLFKLELVEDIPPRQVGVATLKAVPLPASASRFIAML